MRVRRWKITLKGSIKDAAASKKHFFQTDLATHEEWGKLTRKSLVATELLHYLVSRIGANNAVVISHCQLARLTGAHRTTIVRAMKLLKEGRWLQPVQLGDRGTVNAYVINSHVAWAQSRNCVACLCRERKHSQPGQHSPRHNLTYQPLRPLCHKSHGIRIR